MTVLSKARTAIRLLRQGNLPLFRRQLYRTLCDLRIRWHFPHPFVHHLFGFPAVCHPDWVDSADQMHHPNLEVWETTVLRAWLDSGDCIIDVGANTGIYTFAAAAAVGRGGRVIAIDADPFIVERLRRAAGVLPAPQVEPVHAAICDQRGELAFFIRENRSLTGEQSLRPTAGQLALSREIRVPALTLTAIASRHAQPIRPAAVKIDIEGAESAALRSAPAQWLQEDGPLWIVEVNPGPLREFACSPEELIGYFAADRFDRWLLPKHPVAGTAPKGLRAVPDGYSDFGDAAYYNLIAVPRSRSAYARRERVRQFFR